MSTSNLRFGHFELQPRERRLLVDGVPAALGTRALDLLLALVARPGQLVTKSELLDGVWPGLVVEEANLTVQVSSLRKVLGGDLIATIPGRGYRFTGKPVHGGEDVASRTLAQASSDLPPGSPADQGPAVAAPAAAGVSQAPAPPVRALIGRDDDLARIAASLRQPGLVTLTGPAGIGKTSLARVLVERAERGTMWVDLAPLPSGEHALAALARALGIPLPEGDPLPALLRALAGRLLVLDNVEHVVNGAAALVAQLLRAAPALHVLATSQRALRVEGERVQRIGPLALPLDDDALDLHQGAIALFVERARAADHRFAGSPEQLPLLREICRRLDGIPLALEMAAARVPVLGLVGLHDALEQRFALLSVGRRDAALRHRTLEAALDWSHDLLAPEEQRLFRVCGVFCGGFTLELLVQVAAERAQPSLANAAANATANGVGAQSRWAVIDTLAQLVDGSLVSSDTADPPRFALLETMRDYALRRLAAADDEAEHRARHAHALADLARRAIEPATDLGARALLLAEHDNLREAIAWLLANEPARAVEMAVWVSTSASLTPWRVDAMRWLESCEAAVEGGGVRPPLQAQWWAQRGRQRLMSRDSRARDLCERALALYRDIGDDMGEFRALDTIARASFETGDDLDLRCAAMRALLGRHPEWPPSAALQLAGVEALACESRGDFEGRLRYRLEEYELAGRAGLQESADAADTNVVAALIRLGRHEEALARSRTILEQLAGSDSINAAYAWNGYLGSLVQLDRYDEFRTAAPRAARVMRKHGLLPVLADSYALLLAQQGRAHDAARMIGHARSAYKESGMAIEQGTVHTLERAEGIARKSLDNATFDERVAEGRLLDDAAADRLALGPS